MKLALLLCGLFAAASLACTIAGVWMLFGLGWALLAAAVPTGAAAVVLGRGLIKHV